MGITAGITGRTADEPSPKLRVFWELARRIEPPTGGLQNVLRISESLGARVNIDDATDRNRPRIDHLSAPSHPRRTPARVSSDWQPVPGGLGLRSASNPLRGLGPSACVWSDLIECWAFRRDMRCAGNFCKQIEVELISDDLILDQASK